MMATRKWLDNAFWHNDEKEIAEAILVITDDEGRNINQVVTVRKFDQNENINPDWEELISQVSVEQIDKNTAEKKKKQKFMLNVKKQKNRQENLNNYLTLKLKF